jgi:hypothetical protein
MRRHIRTEHRALLGRYAGRFATFMGRLANPGQRPKDEAGTCYWTYKVVTRAIGIEPRRGGPSAANRKRMSLWVGSGRFRSQDVASFPRVSSPFFLASRV